jgi:flagellar biogenesis protein FliO
MTGRHSEAHAATHDGANAPRVHSVHRRIPALALAVFCSLPIFALAAEGSGSGASQDAVQQATLLLPQGAMTPAGTRTIEPPDDEALAAALLAEAPDGPTVRGGSTTRAAAVLFLGAGLVAAVGFVLQRRRNGGSPAANPIRHLQSIRLGARQQVTLVEIDGRRLLLGVSDKDIRLLGDLAGTVEQSAETTLRDVLDAANSAQHAAPPRSARPARPVAARREPSIDLDAGERLELSAQATRAFADLAVDPPQPDSARWDAAFENALRDAARTPEVRETPESYPAPRRFARVAATPSAVGGEPRLELAHRERSLLDALAPEERASLSGRVPPTAVCDTAVTRERRLDAHRSSERQGIVDGLASLRSRSTLQ